MLIKNMFWKKGEENYPNDVYRVIIQKYKVNVKLVDFDLKKKNFLKKKELLIMSNNNDNNNWIYFIVS